MVLLWTGVSGSERREILGYLHSVYRRDGRTEWANALIGNYAAVTHVWLFVIYMVFLFLSVHRHVYRVACVCLASSQSQMKM